MPEPAEYYGGYQAPALSQGYAYPYAAGMGSSRQGDYGGSFMSPPGGPGWPGGQPYGDAGLAAAQQLQGLRAVQPGAPGTYGYLLPPRAGGGGGPAAERGLRHSQQVIDEPPGGAPGGAGLGAPGGMMLGGYGAAGDAQAAHAQGQPPQMHQPPSTPELQQMMQQLALQPLPQPPPSSQ